MAGRQLIRLVSFLLFALSLICRAQSVFPPPSGGGGASSLPLLSAFTWVNQGTATAKQTQANGPIQITVIDNATSNWRLLKQAVPATPYKLVVELRSTHPRAANSQAACLYFYDGTKLEGFEFLSALAGVQPAIFKMNDTGGTGRSQVSAGYFTAEVAASVDSFKAPVWLQFRNDGTSIYFDWSVDGLNFTNLYSETMATFITPTSIGIGALSVANDTSQWVEVNVLGWNFVANATL